MGSSSRSISKLFSRPSKRLTLLKSNVESATSSNVASSPSVAPFLPEGIHSKRPGKERCSVVVGVGHATPENNAFEALLAKSDEGYEHSSLFNRTSSVESSSSEYSSSPSESSSFSHSSSSRNSENRYEGNYSFSEVEAPADFEADASEEPPETDATSSCPEQAEEYLDMGLVNKIFEKIVNPRARREGMCPGPRVGNAILSAYKKELLETVLAIEDSFASPIPKSGFITYPWEKSPDVSYTSESSPNASSSEIDLEDISETVEDKELILPVLCKPQEHITPRPILLPAHILLRREQLKARGISADGVIHAPNTRLYRSCSIPPIEKF